MTTLDAPKLLFEEEKRNGVINSLINSGIDPIIAPSSREATEMGSFLSNDQFSALRADGPSTRRNS